MNLCYSDEMYDDDLIRVVLRLSDWIDLGNLINKLLEYLIYWIHNRLMDRQIFRYFGLPYDRHDYPVELYNLETIYKKINEQCIKDIIEYVSLNPIINVKKILIQLVFS